MSSTWLPSLALIVAKRLVARFVSPARRAAAIEDARLRHMAG
jgi:hypothetical protein